MGDLWREVVQSQTFEVSRASGWTQFLWRVICGCRCEAEDNILEGGLNRVANVLCARKSCSATFCEIRTDLQKTCLSTRHEP